MDTATRGHCNTWTLQPVAEMAKEQGLTGDKVLNIESVRVALRRLGLNGKRVKAWINSPVGASTNADAAYARKKSDVIGCSL